MNYLYILSEDESDDFFYKGCVEKITGEHFELIPRRIRKVAVIAVRLSSTA
jgi:hypothetical protein